MHHCPSRVRRPLIKFFCVLALALWWKNLVFLSLAASQVTLDHCLQCNSSDRRKELISAFNSLIRILCWSFELSCSKASREAHRAWTWVWTFPKHCLLHSSNLMRHLLILSVRIYIGLPLPTSKAHAWRMTPSHFGCVVHLSSNRTSLYLRLWGCCCLKVTRINKWLEEENGTCMTTLLANHSDHEVVAKARSKRSCTLSIASWLLSHV